ncbi:MAG: immune inhibitor A [Bacteroidales bacterium]|nr:immune inhibitor A [Bacteroidales bacterium]
MHKIFILILLVTLPFLAFNQESTYSRIKIHLDGKNIQTLFKAGIELNQINQKEGWATAELSDQELQKVIRAGFEFEVLIPDMSRYYAERYQSAGTGMKNLDAFNTSAWPVPAHFSLGSCGGFLTIEEMLAQLDEMRELYPNLITIKQLVSDTITTIEGRPVYYVKISDNPDIAETEPQVLYTGMHHAREPIGMQHLMYYMWYLLENYAGNSDVRDVVDNTEMYFVPVINVDGYQYNITTNPFGGGMWRKNRRNSGGGDYGIDINRNYGYMWGYDDEGSSPDPSSDLYRGTAPFSEPETRMMKYFCEGHDFLIALNYHSYSNLFLYPWGWTPDLSPDESLLNAYAAAMTAENGYTFGPGSTTIYPTNGGSDDWMYGEQTSKSKILSYTPEVGGGSDGFWPTEERILPLCQENMLASLTAARLVGKFGKIKDIAPLFIYQDNGYVKFEVKRLGMQEGDFTVSIEPLGDAFASFGSPVTYSGMALLEKRTDSIAYQLAPVNHVGDTLRYVLTLDNGLYTVKDTAEKIFGYPYPVFTDYINNKNNWTGNWTLINTDYFSPPSCLTDSPFGNYGSNANRSISLVNSLSLGEALLTVLEFKAKWALENDFDFVQLKISEDNGTSWTPLEGKYSNPGSIYQLTGQPLYDGMESEWVSEAISLNNWQDKSIKLRFTLDTDGGTELDGFYFDDVQISILLDPTAISEASPSRTWLGIPTPNPASGQVRVSYLVPSKLENPVMRVLDATGKEVTTLSLMQNEGWAEFNVSNWAAGIYFIRLEIIGLPAQVTRLVVY